MFFKHIHQRENKRYTEGVVKVVIKASVRGKKSFEPRPMTMDPMVKKRPNNATAAIEIHDCQSVKLKLATPAQW